MTESTTEFFNNFERILYNYIANAYGIGADMAVYKTLNGETKEEYKNKIRKKIKAEIKLEKSLEEYTAYIVDKYGVNREILNAIESLRKNSYDAGKAYYRSDTKEEYRRLHSVLSKDYDAFINYMEKELENA